MRHTIRPVLTTVILATLVAGCVAYVPSRRWSGHHGHRHDQGYDHDHDRRDWDHDRFDDRPRRDRRYR